MHVLLRSDCVRAKVSQQVVSDAIAGILKHAEEKKRKFTETIELQIALKNYDAARDKRIGGSIKLPLVPKPKVSVCVLGDAKHCQEAKEAGIPYLSEEDLNKFNRDQKQIKKMARKYNDFLASAALIKKIPRILGPGLSKAGKFPQVVQAGSSLRERAEDAAATIKFQLKVKAGAPLCMAAAVAHVGMTPEEIERNLMVAINFMVSLLKKKWQNVKRLYIKSTMGPAFKIYGL